MSQPLGKRPAATWPSIWLAALSIAYFIVLFLPWVNTSIVDGFGFTINGWSGPGTAAGVFALLVCIFEILQIARVPIPLPAPARSLIPAGVGSFVVLMAVINILTNLSLLTTNVSLLFAYGLFAWLGLAIALAMGYPIWGHWDAWQKERAAAASGYTALQQTPFAGQYPQQPPPMAGVPATSPPSTATSTPSAAAAFCTACGTRITPGTRFCTGCGVQIAAST